MFERVIKLFQFLDRRIKVAILGSGIANFANQMTKQYDTLYASDLGADPVNLGFLSSISSAFASIMAIPMGWAEEKYSIKRVMRLNLTLFSIQSVY